MIHRSSTLEIDATAEEIWAVIGRYMFIHEYAPFVKTTDALTTGDDGVGSKRRNNFENGTTMVEEAIVWTPGLQQRVKGSEFGKLPFRHVEADISLEALNNGRTKVTGSLDFLGKRGPLGWLMGHTVVKLSMGKFLKANLDGLSKRVAITKRGNA
jgi:hypothetical protein